MLAQSSAPAYLVWAALDGPTLKDFLAAKSTCCAGESPLNSPPPLGDGHMACLRHGGRPSRASGTLRCP